MTLHFVLGRGSFDGRQFCEKREQFKSSTEKGNSPNLALKVHNWLTFISRNLCRIIIEYNCIK